MPRSVVGTYRNGTIELVEPPDDLLDGTPVIVTFLDPASRPIDLRAFGISNAEAAELRARFATIAEDWNRPEMAIYNNYENVWDLLERLAGTVEAPDTWSLRHDDDPSDTSPAHSDPPTGG